MKEQWKKIAENNNSEFYVSSLGRCKRVCKSSGESGISFGGWNSKVHYYQFAGDFVHRHVAKAFVPNPDNKPHVDHINSNTFDNRAENLRWVTRQENNSTEHSKKMHSINAWATSHKDEIIKASKDGQYRYFKNGYTCAKALGVSSSFVYNCLNVHGSAYKAKGWSLEWISRQTEEAQVLVKEIVRDKNEKYLAAQQKRDEQRAKNRAKAQANAEARKQKRLEKIEHQKREKQLQKIHKKIAKIEARIRLWENHLETSNKRDKIEQKICDLKQEKAKLCELGYIEL